MLERRQLITVVAGGLVLAILFFVIGYFSRPTGCNNDGDRKGAKSGMSIKELDEAHQSIVNLMKTDQLKKNMHYFAKHAHVASTPRTFENSQEIFNRFTKYGFKATFHNYTTLLAYSKRDDPNFVYVKEGSKTLFKSRDMEIIHKDLGEGDDTSLPPFHAYSMNGAARGKDLVYANFGRDKDFQKLISLGVNVTDRIVLTKYGMGGRAGKVLMAEKYGAAGILIYADPKQYAPVLSEKFPNGRWLSDDGVQRGSVMSRVNGVPEGDPMSGGYPAKDWAYRPDDVSEVEGISKIPSQPIAASDAEQLLSYLGGEEVVDDEDGWRGTLNVTSYRYGPLNNTALKVDLVVNNENKITGIRNVCGFMKGNVEPDRYVMLGNHIDSWVKGAVDATSGTTVMMEIARVIGQKSKTGWRPRRSIMLCGWDAEESGKIGSIEFVEEFYSQLHDKVVAYINIDSAVAGNNSLRTSASPLLHDLMFGVHKSVRDPYRDESVFDRCKIEYQNKEDEKNHLIYPLTSGSDYFPFHKFMGIPSIDMMYSQSDLDKIYNTSYYPQYHSLHDTIYWMETFVDSEYKIHLTAAKVGLLYLLRLADYPLIPFTMARYVNTLSKGAEHLKDTIKNEHKLDDQAIIKLFKPLDDGVESFSRAVSTFTAFLTNEDNMKRDDAMFMRMVNDKLAQLEKGFTYPGGVPGRPQLKHYLMTSSAYSKFKACPLPALSDLLPELTKDNFKKFKIQMSITTSLIRAVAESLLADL
ncbi:glutamate carboxypeptidase 2-like [Clytia hemisphaerica]|uniref:Uncharacterized protein n=1 Tax=Clytia hemisphaerica TaxID=252671 RepID=A0A7M5X665_9CNID